MNSIVHTQVRFLFANFLDDKGHLWHPVKLLHSHASFQTPRESWANGCHDSYRQQKRISSGSGTESSALPFCHILEYFSMGLKTSRCSNTNHFSWTSKDLSQEWTWTDWIHCERIRSLKTLNLAILSPKQPSRPLAKSLHFSYVAWVPLTKWVYTCLLDPNVSFHTEFLPSLWRGLKGWVALITLEVSEPSNLSSCICK